MTVSLNKGNLIFSFYIETEGEERDNIINVHTPHTRMSAGTPQKKYKEREYIEILEKAIETKIRKWVEKNGYTSVDDVKKDLKLGSKDIYEVIRWKKIARNLENVNINTLNQINPALVLEGRIDSAKYINNTGKLRINLSKFLNDRIFSKNEEESEEKPPSEEFLES